MKTRREIIIETSKAYTTRNRSVIGLSCAYKDPDGNKCAVGRCLEGNSHFFHERNNCKSIVLFEDGIETELKEEYRGHCIDFWQQLQRLHDGSAYWSYAGITKKGEEYVQSLLDTWGEK